MYNKTVKLLQKNIVKKIKVYTMQTYKIIQVLENCCITS